MFESYVLDLIVIFILLLSSFSFFLFKEFRASKWIFILIFVGMVIRIIFIIINTYFYTLPGSDMDAQRFVRNAELIISDEIDYDNIVGATIYEYFLSISFRVFDHLLFAFTLSNIAFFISTLFILKILNMLKTSKKLQFLALFILFFYPSLLLHTVTTLREPYQFLFLTLTIFFYLLLVYEKFNFNYLIMMSISIILFGLLHNGLLGFTPIMIIVLTMGLLKNSKSTNTSFIIIIYSISLLAFVLILTLTGFISSTMVEALIQGEGMDYAEDYREFVPDVRSSYDSSINLSNPLVALLTISESIFKYFTYPLPWHITSPKDFVSIIENTIRAYMLYYVFKNNRFLNSLLPILVLYILIEVLWSMGTANWGTASRHHIIQSQLLLITFIYMKEQVVSAKNTNDIT